MRDAAGGIEHHLGQAQGAARVVLDAMPTISNQAEFEKGVDKLPSRAQTAVYAELALTSGGSVHQASEAELEHFASMPEGAELVQEWRSRAGRNVGIIHDRLNRMLERMSPADGETTWQWLENLPPAQAKAIFRALAR